MLEETADREEIIARVAALDIGKAEVVCCVRVPQEGLAGPAAAGSAGVLHDDPVAAGHGRPAAQPGGDPGGDGSNVRLGVSPASEDVHVAASSGH